MRRFLLIRNEDISGVSGTGIVAEGVQFHDGACVMSWFGDKHALEMVPDIDTIIDIHGHEGRTVIEWLDRNIREEHTQ